MSSVSGVMLIASGEDDIGEEGSDLFNEQSPERQAMHPVTLFAQADQWLLDRGFRKMVPVPDSDYSSKHPQFAAVWGGFDHFPEDEFADFVMGLPWEWPENVVLVIQPEEGATRVFRPTGRTTTVPILSDSEVQALAEGEKP